MAAKTDKSRNSDRRNGKAWGKNHATSVKTMTKEQEERKAHKDAERAKRRVPRLERGPALTMPKLTWEWCMTAMSGRMTNTRKYRIIGAIYEMERNGARTPVSN